MPDKTALLLVDFISLFDFDTGPRLLPRALRAARATAKLKARARRARIPCIYANDNYGNWTSEFSSLVRRVLRQEGGAREIAELLHPLPGDRSILKPRHSAFYGTPLEFLLEELEVTHLILTGVTVDQCIFATAQDAYVRKYQLSIPADCVAACTAAHEKSSLAHMARTLKADIRPLGGKRPLRRG